MSSVCEASLKYTGRWCEMASFTQVGSLVSFETSTTLKNAISMEDIEKRFHNKKWFATWKEKYPGGSIQYDFIDFSCGDCVVITMVPEKNSDRIIVLRMFSHVEGAIESVFKALSEIVEPSEVHRVEIGIIKRHDATGTDS